MGKRIVLSWLILFSWLFPYLMEAKDTKVISATKDYYLSKNETERVGRIRAIEEAKIKALANAFGTYVTSSVNMTQTVDGTGERESYNSFSSSDVAGIWVKTLEEKTEISLEGSDIVIKAFVKGEARSRSVSVPEFEVSIGRIDAFSKIVPTTQFKDRERFDMTFVSPQAGYVTIYASDGKSDVCRLLPDANSPITEPIFVNAHQRYQFFEDLNPVMALGKDEESALLRITVLFLPSKEGKPFQLPIDTSKLSPQGDVLGWLVGNDAYNKWLSKCLNDPSFQRKDMIVSIIK